MQKTFSARQTDVQRSWYIVSARGEPLGRLAARIAAVLRGKHKPIFTPHVDCGDFVIVTDAEHVHLTGTRPEKKMYHRHTGYPGGLKSVPYAQLLARDPVGGIMKAVRGMLPKNKLGRRQLTKLRVYRGSDHPHSAQQPQPLDAIVASSDQ
ncbi:MAG: 50S ribosomal protein L13 [Armatimonadota bacterium]|jgi:large subunit ribosomal protein L13